MAIVPGLPRRPLPMYLVSCQSGAAGGVLAVISAFSLLTPQSDIRTEDLGKDLYYFIDSIPVLALTHANQFLYH